MVSALLLFSWTELFFGKDKVLQQKARFPMGLLVCREFIFNLVPKKVSYTATFMYIHCRGMKLLNITVIPAL